MHNFNLEVGNKINRLGKGQTILLTRVVTEAAGVTTSVALEKGCQGWCKPVSNALGRWQQQWFPWHGLEQCPGSPALNCFSSPFNNSMGYWSSLNKPNYLNKSEGILLFIIKNPV